MAGDVEFHAGSQPQDLGNGAQAVESERLEPNILRLGVTRSGFEGVANQNQFVNYRLDWLRGLDLNQRPLGYEWHK